MLDEKAWLTIFIPVHPSSVKSSSFPPNSSNHVFMDLAYCTGAQSCWNIKGTFPNCFCKAASIALSKIYWNGEALRLPFTGSKEPSPTHEKNYPTCT